MARSSPARREWLQLLLLVAVHVELWWLVALLVHAPADIQPDMAEAFAWGQELQWGYHKHPPFWAWLARGWFALFPAADWAFFLLSVVNSAAGLVGVWAIAGRYVSGERRLAAVMLLELVPFYHFFAFNYNANAIQLSLWPWTIYAFLVSFETRRVAASVGFGLLAAATMLSKYFGGVLLAGCALAALTDPRARDYFRSPAPYLGALAFGLAMAPHVMWLLQAASGPLDYLASKTAYPFGFILERAGHFIVGCLLLNGALAVMLAAVWRQMRRDGPAVAAIEQGGAADRLRVRRLMVLVVAPILVTVVVALVGNVRLSTKFALPLFALLPLLWMVLYGARFGGAALRTVMLTAGGLMFAALLLAVPAAALKFRFDKSHYAEPRAIVAREVTQLWHAAMRTPLRLVAGTEAYAFAATFYSADHPGNFTDFSQAKAPWVDDARLGRDGLAIICLAQDGACLDRISDFEAFDSVRLTLDGVAKDFLGMRGAAFSFVVLLVRPGQDLRAPRDPDCADGVGCDREQASAAAATDSMAAEFRP
ncbi:glycosyltransferase family 39 protein [Bradyrhizobium sp. 2TAF24]|uniref:glycosyltransferase family 39 protein n=1 Tax=Bradyrhizobium sp. 2TAF24 TaxID=3233011 RepID=UPI003F911E55